jgi:hypothetical protein
MKYTSAFCISLLLCASVWAQEVKTTPVDSFAFGGDRGKARYVAPKKDSTPVKTDRYGLRVGVDLSKLARSFYEDNYKGLEIVGDYRLTKKILACRRNRQRKQNHR